MTKKRENPETEAHRFSVVKLGYVLGEAWLCAGIPLQNAKLRSVLEDCHPLLAALSTLSEQIPLIHVVENLTIGSELQQNIKPNSENGEIDTIEVTLFLKKQHESLNIISSLHD